MTIPKPKLSKARKKALVAAVNAGDPAPRGMARVAAMIAGASICRALGRETLPEEEGKFLLKVCAADYDRFKRECPADYYAALMSVKATLEAMIEQATPFPVSLDRDASNFDA